MEVEQATSIMQEVLERVRAEDPVRGSWNMFEIKKGVVRCDMSSIAIGVILEVMGRVGVEDTV